ncbi:DUF1853 family protein [Burkholderia sp. FERM BP-3421]|jgi:hypothetical protein|uniref:DUF1853 family protein n=1 Tax=Burkholderia sp. FERM BP-3421 TaxID=1494466 RepID=UPI0023603099|nr:DUF1853 family protein [Burkholderia sp. FERM BP-3421]WDD93752.1 DUF1853 family protein [Burkholderia sp. FERM BP-3421]
MSAAAPAGWRTLRDPAVRDLGWLLESAPLFAATPDVPLAQPAAPSAGPAALGAWLAALDRQPDALHRALAHARPTRLGRYAEELIGFFAAHAPGWRLVAANLPLRSHGRTLGECDFLLETMDGARLHWELAVKCYLCAAEAGTAALADFVGPNLADRFDLKRRKLVEHQLRLTHLAAFAALGHAGPWQAQMLVKGWLFYRAARVGLASPVNDPPVLHAGHPRGFWITHADWRASLQAEARDASRWIVLPRLAWLAPRRIEAAQAEAEGMHASALLERVSGQAAPSLVAVLGPDAEGAWVERARGFIVPDAWPGQATAFAAAVL